MATTRNPFPQMAKSSTQPAISPMAQAKVMEHAKNIFLMLRDLTHYRGRLIEQDRQYYREMDRSQMQGRADLANTLGDPSKIQNITVPVVGPQVDSAKAYLTEMFLSSYPIFPVTASPEHADTALQLETLLGNSAVHFQWGRHLALCMHDGLKHNLQAIEVSWKRETTASIRNDASQSVTEGVVQEETFSGNMLKHLNLYNLIFDPRVPPAEMHKRGEFAGYTELLTRIELKQLLLDLDRTLTMNATQAFESPTAHNNTADMGAASFYMPSINPKSLVDPANIGFNWLKWAKTTTNQKIRYQDMYEVTTLYCRVIPKELMIFPQDARKTAGEPQIYKFIIVNQRVLIFAQRMTNAHGYIPIIIGQMNEDGLGLQTKSFADNATPYQQIATSLWNSGIASQRRKVYDRIYYDPSRINKADMDKTDPVARIPVKQTAYGLPIGEAIFVAPYRDEGVASILGMAREVVDMADIASGQNRVQRGQFQKGNKTRTEFNEVMQNSDARPRMAAILLGISWFQPIKDVLKTDILQYQPPATLFNPEKQKSIKIDPVTIRTVAWQFQLADGVMPSDKFLNFELFGQVLQFATAVPQAAAEWDLPGMFAYQLKMQGAKWVANFRRTPEQQQAYLQQQQAMNATSAPGMPQQQIPQLPQQ